MFSLNQPGSGSNRFLLCICKYILNITTFIKKKNSLIIISKEAGYPKREKWLCDHFTVIYFTNFILQIYSNFYYINNTLWTFLFPNIIRIQICWKLFSIFVFISRINNSSTVRGFLESTGLDDLMISTCVCLFGPEELPPAATREQANNESQAQTGARWGLAPAPALKCIFPERKKNIHCGNLNCSSVFTPRFNQSAEDVNYRKKVFFHIFIIS